LTIRAPLRRAVLIVVIAAIVGGGLVYGFWPQPLAVDLATIERGSIQVTVDGEGQARVRNVYVVSAPLAGRITRVSLKPGDEVEANRTLITSLEETDPAFLDARTRASLEAKQRPPRQRSISPRRSSNRRRPRWSSPKTSCSAARPCSSAAR
jgi:HlyD family secretion protein